MMVTLEEMKEYLRVDFMDEDELIIQLIHTAEQLCTDIIRAKETTELESVEQAKVAIMYTVAYLYEHREEADHQALMLTLRALLFGSRQEGF